VIGADEEREQRRRHREEDAQPDLDRWQRQRAFAIGRDGLLFDPWLGVQRRPHEPSDDDGHQDREDE
jgi:hypothetical protein